MCITGNPHLVLQETHTWFRHTAGLRERFCQGSALPDPYTLVTAIECGGEKVLTLTRTPITPGMGLLLASVSGAAVPYGRLQQGFQ